MKISIIPVIVAGGVLVGTLITTNITNNNRKNEMESIIRGLEGKDKEQQGTISDNEKTIEELRKKLENKKQKVTELEAKLAEKQRQNTPSRGVSLDLNSGSCGKFIGTFKATGYDDTPQSQGKWVGKTATGVKPQHGVIAVDPKVIPLGTKLYVEGYGNCVAGDTGGAIKGHRVDLFFHKRSDAMKWGRRDVKVYIRE